MLAARRMMISAPSIVPVAIPGTSNSGGGHTGTTNSVTTASAFTPTANALILICMTAYIGSATGPAITASDTFGGLTWTEVTTGWHTDAANNVYKTSIFYAFAPSSPTSGTVTLTAAAVSARSTVLSLTACQATGVNRTTPVAQSASALISGTTGNGTTTHSLTDTLGSVPTGEVFAVLGQHYTTPSNPGVAPGADPNFTHLVYYRDAINSVEIDLDVSCATTRQSITWTGLLEGGSFVAWWYYGLLIELNN